LNKKNTLCYTDGATKTRMKYAHNMTHLSDIILSELAPFCFRGCRSFIGPVPLLLLMILVVCYEITVS